VIARQAPYQTGSVTGLSSASSSARESQALLVFGIIVERGTWAAGAAKPDRSAWDECSDGRSGRKVRRERTSDVNIRRAGRRRWLFRAVDGVPAGTNLAPEFRALPDWRWEPSLAKPITSLPKGKLTVSIRDPKDNVTRVERTFSVGNR